MRDQVITPELRQWIIDQVGLGHRPDAVLRSMCDTGWDREIAVTALEETIAGYLDDFAYRQQAPTAGLTHSAALPPGANECLVEGHTVQVLATVHVPAIVMFGKVLTATECDELVALARPHALQFLSVSSAVRAEGGASPARAGTGTVFKPRETALCARIERRIAGLLEEPLAHCEGLQVLCYPAGAQYRPQEYLSASSRQAARLAARRPVSVLMVYLNTPEQGGSTLFPEIGLEINPVQGNGIFFGHDQADAHSHGLHDGSPVFRGEQWVLVKWIEAEAEVGLSGRGPTSPSGYPTRW